MKRTTFALAFALIGTSAVASEHGKVHAQAWNTQSLSAAMRSMPVGDIARGQALHKSLMCASCHGEAGVSPSRNWASLAGQKAPYTYKMMLDYQDSRRAESFKQSDIMVQIAQLMNHQDMADVAAYYASLPLPAPIARERPIAPATNKVVRFGDVSRLVTACASCHGTKGQGGMNETPAIAGQVKDYFIRTMQAYKHNDRTNDLHQGMAQFTKGLTDGEIEALADYYASLGHIAGEAE
jgi:cytochrome c553